MVRVRLQHVTRPRNEWRKKDDWNLVPNADSRRRCCTCPGVLSAKIGFTYSISNAYHPMTHHRVPVACPFCFSDCPLLCHLCRLLPYTPYFPEPIEGVRGIHPF